MTNLYADTLKLLHELNPPVSDVIAKTGLKQRWLYRLIAGDWTDPGVNKIQELHNYLVARQAEQGKSRAA